MNVQQYADYVAETIPVCWIDGAPWRIDRRILRPLTPPHLIKPVDPRKIRKAMRENGALMASWVDAWDTPECQWWHIGCSDKDYDIDSVPSKSRRKFIRKGMRLCEVRRMPLEEFGEKGHVVHMAAASLYGDAYVPIGLEEFRKGVSIAAKHDAWEVWGAFCEGKLAAYDVCIPVDGAILNSSSKSDPALHKCRPNEAMQFEMTRQYMRQGARYISNGVRVLLHDTHVQEFMLSMGYRRIYCPLRAEISWVLSAALWMGADRWGKRAGLNRLVPGVKEKLAAVRATKAIARECRRIPPANDAPLSPDNTQQSEAAS